jgi:PAS domain S-box-containing protein
MIIPRTYQELLKENEHLHWRLEESEAIVDAIRKGIIDAVVVSNPGESVYTLEGADRPYRLLIEAMQQSVAVLNHEGLILYCNPCFVNLFASTSETLIGTSLDRFVSETDFPRWTAMLQDGVKFPTDLEVQLKLQDGTQFPSSLTLISLPLQRVCLLVTNLSQQKTYDQLVLSKLALRESEIRYRRLFETAKDGILILDTQTGRITDANPYMSELLGYSKEHFAGKELREIGLFCDRASNEAAVRELQQLGYIRFEHLPLETSQGERVEVEIVANSYREDDHSVIQCNIRDITERSRLEAQRDRLEKRMQEQSASLEDLHRRKDEFLAMLSHELRNPLSPIASALQLLGLQKNEDRLQHQARTIIERQVGQLTRLIDDLLEVSRITTGRIHLQQEPIVLNDVVKNAIETVRTLIDRHKHCFLLSIPSQPIPLFADAARLEQVVVNLLSNAAKFTPDEGQIHLTVTIENRAENGEWEETSSAPSSDRSSDAGSKSPDFPFAVIRVRDTGIGIAEDLLPHVFDLFTQAERSLARSQGGLGIGLALVQRIVEMHKGLVEAKSVLGQGSEFVVRLPLMLLREMHDTQPHVVKSSLNSSPLKILVVDDNADAAEMLGMLLLASGHEVLTVHDGPSTLDAALRV